jgi:hypothetical protein
MAEKKVPYQVGGRRFEGMIVHGDGVKGKRPVIFMQPDWKGVCADTIGQARIVAGDDYVVLMAEHVRRGLRRHARDPRAARRRHERRARPRLHRRLRRQGPMTRC